ncbi:MAG: hypothetical protein Q9209_002370 [Squamulea sp. 1 TL-2023]
MLLVRLQALRWVRTIGDQIGIISCYFAQSCVHVQSMLAIPKAARTSAYSALKDTHRQPVFKPFSKPTSPETDDEENVAPGSASDPRLKLNLCNTNVDWRDIALEKKLGEVPYYNDASIVPRKVK